MGAVLVINGGMVECDRRPWLKTARFYTSITKSCSKFIGKTQFTCLPRVQIEADLSRITYMTVLESCRKFPSSIYRFFQLWKYFLHEFWGSYVLSPARASTPTFCVPKLICTFKLSYAMEKVIFCLKLHSAKSGYVGSEWIIVAQYKFLHSCL